MYMVVFEKDGETFATWSAQASNEAEAWAKCDAFFRANPEHDPRIGSPGLVTRIEKIDMIKVRSGEAKLPG